LQEIFALQDIIALYLRNQVHKYTTVKNKSQFYKMGRPKIGTEFKKPSDYHYDYPENREISKHLSFEDKKLIAARTGYKITYVRCWGHGKRRNRRIEEIARLIMRLNIAKQRKFNSQPNTSNTK
jgi:hypothetical protein